MNKCGYVNEHGEKCNFKFNISNFQYSEHGYVCPLHAPSSSKQLYESLGKSQQNSDGIAISEFIEIRNLENRDIYFTDCKFESVVDFSGLEESSKSQWVYFEQCKFWNWLYFEDSRCLVPQCDGMD